MTYTESGWFHPRQPSTHTSTSYIVFPSWSSGCVGVFRRVIREARIAKPWEVVAIVVQLQDYEKWGLIYMIHKWGYLFYVRRNSNANVWLESYPNPSGESQQGVLYNTKWCYRNCEIVKFFSSVIAIDLHTNVNNFNTRRKLTTKKW